MSTKNTHKNVHINTQSYNQNMETAQVSTYWRMDNNDNSRDEYCTQEEKVTLTDARIWQIQKQLKRKSYIKEFISQLFMWSLKKTKSQNNGYLGEEGVVYWEGMKTSWNDGHILYSHWGWDWK